MTAGPCQPPAPASALSCVLVTDAAKSARQPVMLGALAQQIYQKHSIDGNGAKDFSSIILQYQP